MNADFWTNLLDLISFMLIAPEILGRDKVAGWAAAIRAKLRFTRKLVEEDKRSHLFEYAVVTYATLSIMFMCFYGVIYGEWMLLPVPDGIAGIVLRSIFAAAGLFLLPVACAFVAVLVDEIARREASMIAFMIGAAIFFAARGIAMLSALG